MALICWVAAGVTITVFNKWLFNAAMGDFPYPVTLVALHQGFVAVLMQVLSVGAPGTIPAVAEKGILVGLSPAAFLRTPVNNIEYFPPNFEGLVLGCIDADFCK